MHLLRSLPWSIVAVALVGCANQVPVNPNLVWSASSDVYVKKHFGEPRHFEDEALVIIGIGRADGNTWLAHIFQFDPKSSNRVGELEWTASGLCRANERSCIGHSVYRMPPGTYAVAYTSDTKKAYSIAAGRRLYEIKRHYALESRIEEIQMMDATLSPQTPRFTVNAGEVVYVGDMVFDFSNDRLRLLLEQHEDKARAALGQIGESRPFVVRPWVSVDNGETRQASDSR